MKKLSSGGVKILKIIHLMFAIIWVGGGLSLALLLFTVSPEESWGMYAKSYSLKLIDDYLIIPGAIGSMLTGLVYGIWTNWGFFKNNWITVKWILTVILVLFGTFAMGPWVNGNVYDIQDIIKYTTDNREYYHNISQTKLYGSIQILFLIFVVVISVIKPWKSKKNKSY